MTAGRTIQLSDGRVLGFAEYGDPGGVPVIALHGLPGSRLKFASFDEPARACGLRIIAVDRWGYGLTSPKSDARLADFGADMMAIADALRLGRCAVLGVSGGGPYAVATALALGKRLRSLALVAPVGAIEADTPLSPIHHVCFRLLPRIEVLSSAGLHAYRAALNFAPELSVRLAFATAARADKRALSNPEICRGLARTFVEGLRPGVTGVLIDMAVLSRSWGIEPRAVQAPVRIWIGTQDRNVPRAAIQTLAEALPTAELVSLPEEGHLWISGHAADVTAWIGAHGR